MFTRWISVDDTKSSLIIGPRRSGKTTLLKTRFPDYTYATLDDLDYLDWAKKDPKGFIIELGKKAIIDEIQRLPLLTVAVKYAIDNENCIFHMTGSSSIGLLDSASDTLAGRINLLSLPPACWGENAGKPDHFFLTEKLGPIKIKDYQRTLNDALTYGHFPEVLEQTDVSDREAVLNNYKNTYFTRDLMQLSNIENLDGLLAIFNHLSRSLGSHLEVSNFAREAGISYPTAKKYLNVLAQSQLTFKLFGYQYGPAKRYLKAAKTYFCDNGIIQSLNVRLNEGQLLENFVIAEFEKRRKLGFINTDQFYYYKSAGGREIDLVFELNGCVYAFEIKSTRNPATRDLRALKEFGKQLKRPAKLFLLYLGDEYEAEDNIHLIPIAALFKGV